jgi:hypothetical protein
MSGTWDSALGAPLAALLETLGYNATDPVVRDAAVPAARGTNLVLAYPPAARYAIPALAGLLSTLKPDGRLLVLAPSHALEEWTRMIAPLARAASLSLQSAASSSRAARRIKDDSLQVLLTTPAIAFELHQRSALKTDRLTHLMLAWPEQFEDLEQLAGLLQDIDKEAPRLVHLSQAAPSRDVVDRYARRAVVTGPLAHHPSTPPPSGIQVATAPWHSRGATLRSVLEVLDPATAVIWAVDAASAREAAEVLGTGDQCTVVTGDAPSASLIVAYDLPEPARLAQLASAGNLVLLVPPHAAAYAGQFAGSPRPLRLPGALETGESLVAARRARIAAACSAPGQTGSLLALAPLFERYDAVDIAAALYGLWSAEVPVAAPVPASTVPATARVWVGTGKKDEVSPNDLVAALTRELKMDRTRIGKIDVRELYCLVEVPAEEAEDIARRLNGVTIRRRRVTARVDRGAGPKARGKPGENSVRREK